jgi:hypothetical protein
MGEGRDKPGAICTLKSKVKKIMSFATELIYMQI